MNLITNVKINSINSLTDARYYSGVGAQYLGFCFVKSSDRYIPTEQVFQIKEWLAGPKVVGEFGNASTVDEINLVVEKIGIDAVFIKDGFPFGSIPSIKVPVILEIEVTRLTDLVGLVSLLETYPENVESFVLNFSEHGFLWNVIEQDPANVEALKAACAQYKIFIDTTITAENIHLILEKINPYGVTLPAGNEEDTGIQSFDDVADLMEALETEF